MFCKKCGYEYPDNEEIKFCKQCGALVTNPLQAANPGMDSESTSDNIAGWEPTKKKPIAIWISIIAVVAIMAVAVVFFISKYQHSEKQNNETALSEETVIATFDPFNGVIVTFEGENGTGTAKYDIGTNSKYKDDLIYELSDENGLSNGDIVKLSIQYIINEDDFIQKYSEKPEMLSKEYEVEGLTEGIADTEMSDETEVDDDTKEFLEKMSGVWGNGSYYEIYDGTTTIKRGEFESDALPDVYISDVKKLSSNKYEVSIKDDAHIDGELYSYDGHDYVAVYDGTIDGFRVSYIASTDDNELIFLKMGNNMEEAWDYYIGDYESDWEMLSRADSNGISDQTALLEEFGVNPNTVEDYSQNLDPDKYIKYNSGIEDFSFSYPSKMFCDVKVDETEEKKVFGKHVKTITFYGSNGSELSYSLYERMDTGSIDDVVERIHNAEKGKYYDAADILASSDEEKGGKIVITGYENSSKDRLVYDSIRISNKYVYQMKALNPQYKDEQERLEYSYITENVYRMCKFSDSKKAPRSYEEYLEANN